MHYVLTIYILIGKKYIIEEFICLVFKTCMLGSNENQLDKDHLQ